MLWTTVQWNCGNVLAIVGFCLLTLVGVAGAVAHDVTHDQSQVAAAAGSQDRPCDACVLPPLLHGV